MLGEIVLNSWKFANNDSDKKIIYENLQNFCISNMKQDNKSNQVSGSLCLSRLIENCPVVLTSNHMKSIWENMCNFLEKSNFTAKSELLDSLISLIFAAEAFFKPFATVTLYKILDYLTDSDWIKRELAVDIIYTLANYCHDEIFTLKSHIIDFLKVLKSDKVKQVREACLVTLKYLNEDDSEEITNKSNENYVLTEKSEENVNKPKDNNQKPVEAINKSSINNNISNINNSVLSSQEKKNKNKSSVESKKNTRNTISTNNNINLITSANKSPFLTNDETKVEKRSGVNTPNRISKRDISKTPEKKEKRNLQITVTSVNQLLIYLQRILRI